MPRDPAGEAETVQWIIAALNSVEMVTVPWWFLGLSGAGDNPLDGWATSRLDHLEAVLTEREWLAAGRFTAADLLMADILRIPKVRTHGDRPATERYVARITDRLVCRKAHGEQLGWFAAADARRAEDHQTS